MSYNVFKKLSRDDIQSFLINGDESEDEFEDDSDSEHTEDVRYLDIQNMPIVYEDLVDDAEETMDDLSGNSEELDENTNDAAQPNTCRNSCNSEKAKKTTKKPIHLKWKKCNFEMPDCLLKFESRSLPPEAQGLTTPMEYFDYFFTSDLISKIAEETNLYTVQNDPNCSFRVTTDDIRKYVGICIYTSIVHVPTVRNYWSDHIGSEIIKNTMSQKQFERIRKFLHFNDNTKILPKDDLNYDRLHKIRPLIESLNTRFGTIPYERDLCVDEQICATKDRSYLKQYMPLKPHKWGYKFFIMSNAHGYIHKFEMYSGQENLEKFRLDNEPDLGSSSNVVIRLTRDVPPNVNHRVYFDNYYTCVPLITFLAKKGIYSLGTARRPRIPNCRLPGEKELKKAERGTAVEYLTLHEGIPITSVVWKDNKHVILLSSFCGVLPMQSVERFDRKTRTKIALDCPAIIKEYNRFMGGVDLLDSLVGRYKIVMRSKKWYMRIWYHLIDLAVINAWLLYRKSESEKGVAEILSLSDFRINIASCLMMMGKVTNAKRGRPSNSLQNELNGKKKKGPASYVPPVDVRTDSVDHWPLHNAASIQGAKDFHIFNVPNVGHICVSTKTTIVFVNFM